MKRLFKLLVVAWLAGEWYTRGGREMLFGDETDPAPPERTLRAWVQLPPPVGHVWTEDSVRQMIGAPFMQGRDGEPCGSVVDARLRDDGVAEVQYEADRGKLGWPINVAISQAELGVSVATEPLAAERERRHVWASERPLPR